MRSEKYELDVINTVFRKYAPCLSDHNYKYVSKL